MKRILYITPGCFDKGGISRYSRYQISALREIFGESNVKVLSLLGPDKDSFEEEVTVDWHGSGASVSSKIAMVLQIIKILILWRPHLIHSAHVNFSGLVHLLCKLFNNTSILNIYGLEIWSGMSLDARYGLKNIDHVISDCHSTKTHVEDNLLRKKGNIKVIWDCVDLMKFKPTVDFSEEFYKKYRLPRKEEYFSILTLGRISYGAAHKGYERLIEVFNKVCLQRSDCRLIIAGKGDMVDHLMEQVQNLNLKDQVIFTGPIHEEDMARIYSYADVFSLVSDKGQNRGEGIPLTPLEAMACGTPILVGNQDGSMEAVSEDLNNGVVLDPFDLEQHAQVIERYAEDRSLLRDSSRQARNAAEAYFSYEIFVEKHHKLFAEI